MFALFQIFLIAGILFSPHSHAESGCSFKYIPPDTAHPQGQFLDIKGNDCVKDAQGNILPPNHPDQTPAAAYVSDLKLSDQDGLRAYRKKKKLASQQGKEIITEVTSMMKRGILPIYYPAVRAGDRNLRDFTTIDFDPSYIDFSDKNDTIKISSGDFLIYPGPGDDEIQYDLQLRKDFRGIFVFNQGWGQDTVRTPCIKPGNVPTTGHDLWHKKQFYNKTFIVFGPGILASDIQWTDAFTLENIRTGDRINFMDTWCGHVVFFEGGEMTPFNWLSYYDHL